MLFPQPGNHSSPYDHSCDQRPNSYDTISLLLSHSPWWSLLRSSLQLVPVQKGRWQTTPEVPSECHSRGTCRRHRSGCCRGPRRARLPPPYLIGHRAGKRGDPRSCPTPSAQASEWGPGLPLLLLMLFCLMHHREAPAAGRARERVTWHLPRLVGQSQNPGQNRAKASPQCGTLRLVSSLPTRTQGLSWRWYVCLACLRY